MNTRSAGNGRYVPKDEANANPNTTVTETAAKKPAATGLVQSVPQKKPSGKFRFYRSRYHGLSIVVKQDPDDHDPTTAVEKVRFEPYEERFQGDTVKRGYLKTDDPKVIARLADDGNVEEIDADEYEKSTDTARSKNPAKRAAY